METTLLSTGEVARRLGASRPHVVDLCDRGALACVRSGVHRRIPEDAVRALLGQSVQLRGEHERSLWLHRVVLDQLAVDPERTLLTASRNVAKWRGAHRPGGRTQSWLDRWQELLDEGPDAVAEVLVSRSPEALELRQNTPFAGMVTPEVRARVLSAFAEHWRKAHEPTRPGVNRARLGQLLVEVSRVKCCAAGWIMATLGR